ncbi:MAG: hypothetical protein LJE87_13020, partial [Deltaproteobacteria bacterium]|nr:hypothetical protein [Deltaproteobacteria bacterium]
SDSRKNEFWQENYPVHWDEIFGYNLRSSFVLLLCNTIEPYMSMVCSNVKTINNSNLSVDDLKGSLYERTRKYLEVVGGFSSPKDREWEIMGDIYALRNVITHNGAMIGGSNKEKRIRSLMKKSPGLSVPSEGMLSIEKSFCEYAIDNVETFVNGLYFSTTVSVPKFNASTKITYETAHDEARA